MSKISINSAAKINLTFDILGTRADGYHDVETIFQSIDLSDELSLELEESDSQEIIIECPKAKYYSNFPLDHSNLIYKAANLFFESIYVLSKKKFKLLVQINKNIPIGAGLAGGSSNAAAVLVALNELFDSPFTKNEIQAFALKLGSDVPFCLDGGTCLGRGRGEILDSIKHSLEFCFCIIKPKNLSISTPGAYSLYDEFSSNVIKPNTIQAKKALESGDIEMLLNSMKNVFEPVIFHKYPQLAKLKNELESFSPWICQMTGSGPTLFAIVSSRQQAHHIRRELLKEDDLDYCYDTEFQLNQSPSQVDFKIANSINYGLNQC